MGYSIYILEIPIGLLIVLCKWYVDIKNHLVVKLVATLAKFWWVTSTCLEQSLLCFNINSMQLCFSAKHPPSPHPVYESKNENKKTQIGEEMLTNAIIYSDRQVQLARHCVSQKRQRQDHVICFINVVWYRGFVLWLRLDFKFCMNWGKRTSNVYLKCSSWNW